MVGEEVKATQKRGQVGGEKVVDKVGEGVVVICCQGVRRRQAMIPSRMVL